MLVFVCVIDLFCVIELSIFFLIFNFVNMVDDIDFQMLKQLCIPVIIPPLPYGDGVSFSILFVNYL